MYMFRSRESFSCEVETNWPQFQQLLKILPFPIAGDVRTPLCSLRVCDEGAGVNARLELN